MATGKVGLNWGGDCRGGFHSEGWGRPLPGAVPAWPLSALCPTPASPLPARGCWGSREATPTWKLPRQAQFTELRREPWGGLGVGGRGFPEGQPAALCACETAASQPCWRGPAESRRRSPSPRPLVPRLGAAWAPPAAASFPPLAHPAQAPAATEAADTPASSGVLPSRPRARNQEPLSGGRRGSCDRGGRCPGRAGGGTLGAFCPSSPPCSSLCAPGHGGRRGVSAQKPALGQVVTSTCHPPLASAPPSPELCGGLGPAWLALWSARPRVDLVCRRTREAGL